MSEPSSAPSGSEPRAAAPAGTSPPAHQDETLQNADNRSAPRRSDLQRSDAAAADSLQHRHHHHHHRRKSRVRGPPNQGFVLTERIGKGSFAIVYKGEWGGDLGPSGGQRQTVAVKIVQRAHLKRDKRLLDNFEAEMAILKQMKHPHIVHLIDVVQTSSDFNLIMEYCSLGDLSNFIRKKQSLIRDSPVAAALFARYPHENGLHPTLVKHFLAQLASSLVFLREHDLMHRDVKPQNLLLMPPAKTEDQARAFGFVGQWDLPVLKIADFGFARFLPAASMAETLCGSPLYMAPEILKGQMYDAKADLWSVGAVAYEMVTGKPPFPAANHIELSKKIDDAKDEIVFPCAVEAAIETIIRGLLKRVPDTRMGFDEFFARSVWPAVSLSSASSTLGVAAAASTRESESVLSVSASASANASASASANASASASVSATSARVASSQLTNSATSGTSSTQGSGRDDYSAYLRRRGASDVAVESPLPSPDSSQSHHNGPEPVAAAGSAVPTTPAPAAKHGTQDSKALKTSESENDYVFIEKRMVEVNSLADDLASPSAPAQRMTNPEHKIGRRRLSSIAYGASPTNALAQALLKSSARLFGAKSDASAASSPTSVPLSVVMAPPQAMEKQVLNDLEQLATIGKVVSLYADVKFAQLDADDDGIGRDPVTSVLFPIKSPSQLDPYFQLRLAQEALVLYLKALSVLARAMSRASEWWEQHVNGQVKTKVPHASPGINALVQWTRDKFNDCVARAEQARELVKRFAQEAGTAAQHVSAEKLLFDRALEMAKAAAMQELVAADADAAAAADAVATCEMNYGTAVWMLRALLEHDQPEEALSDDDRVMVDTLMGKIAQRLAGQRRRTSRSRSQTPDVSQRSATAPTGLASSRVSFSRLTPP